MPCCGKDFQNLCVRLKLSICQAIKIKLFVTCEIQYFELGIFSFNSYVYYLTRGFIASTRAFNLLTRAFNLPTRAFNLPTCAFNHAIRAFRLSTRGFEPVTREFVLVTREFELVICGVELVTRGFELVTRALLFHSLATEQVKHSQLILKLKRKYGDTRICFGITLQQEKQKLVTS